MTIKKPKTKVIKDESGRRGGRGGGRGRGGRRPYPSYDYGDYCDEDDDYMMPKPSPPTPKDQLYLV